MRIGVYVGSFDPVHIGHMHIVYYLLNNNYLDKVIIVPTCNYWDKNNLTSLEYRIGMLKFYENDKIIINTKYNGLSYTYEILEKLGSDYSNSMLYLIIGADNLVKFNLWKNVDKILENKVLVLPRNGINSSEYINNFKEKDNFIVLDNFKEMDISSSMIRSRLYKRDYEGINEYLNSVVLDYIYKNSLYLKEEK